MKNFLILPVMLFTGSANAFVVDASSLGRSVTADGAYGYMAYESDTDGRDSGNWGSGVAVEECSELYQACFDVIYAGMTSTMPDSGSYDSYTLSFDLTTFESDWSSFEEDGASAYLRVELTFDEQVRYDFTALCETGARGDLFDLASTAIQGSSSIGGDFGSCASAGSGILDAGTYELLATSDASAYMDYSVTISAVPVPPAIWLFGSALAGLGWMRQKKAV